MNPNEKKEVPHHHQCTVVNHLIGCENPNCQVDYWTVCRDPKHIEIYRSATVHLMPVDGILPCCGKREVETKVGDRKAYDPRLVNCPGAQQQQAVHYQVHDPFGPEAEQEAKAASMAGPGIVE